MIDLLTFIIIALCATIYGAILFRLFVREETVERHWVVVYEDDEGVTRIDAAGVLSRRRAGQRARLLTQQGAPASVLRLCPESAARVAALYPAPSPSPAIGRSQERPSEDGLWRGRAGEGAGASLYPARTPSQRADFPAPPPPRARGGGFLPGSRA